MESCLLNNHLSYRAEIDGMRALAVLMVIAAHLRIPGFEGGYIGVDIFFVISGYLITSIIFAKTEQQAFSFADFYTRRFLRIYPAMLLTVIISVCVAYFIFMPKALLDAATSGFAAIFSFANIYFFTNMGYFDGAAIEKPLLHMWSLSVEEQFYIFFPVALYLVHKYLPKHIKTFFFVIFVVSFLLASWGAYQKPSASFFLPVTRAWELLAGSFVAFFLAEERVRLALANRYSIFAKQGLSLLGIGLILLACFGFDEATVFPGISALLPVVGTILFLLFANTQSLLVYKAFTLSPIRFIGNISYSLYLVHWPIIVLTQYYLMREFSALEKLVSFVVMLGISMVMYKTIEVPLRKSDKQSKKRNVVISLILTALSLVLVCLVIFKQGFPSRFADYAVPENKQLFQEVNEICFTDLSNTKPNTTNYKDCDLDNVSQSPKSVVLIGDSYAKHYALALNHAINSDMSNFYYIGAGSCPHLFGFKVSFACEIFNRNVRESILQDPPELIIMSANWWSYARDRNLLLSLEDTIKEYQGNGSKVIVIGVSPVYPSQVPYIALRHQISQAQNEQYFIQFDEHLDASLRDISVSSGAQYFSVYNLWCVGRSCTYRDSEHLFHVDFGHLSHQGASLVVDEMKRQNLLNNEPER